MCRVDHAGAAKARPRRGLRPFCPFCPYARSARSSDSAVGSLKCSPVSKRSSKSPVRAAAAASMGASVRPSALWCGCCSDAARGAAPRQDIAHLPEHGNRAHGAQQGQGRHAHGAPACLPSWPRSPSAARLQAAQALQGGPSLAMRGFSCTGWPLGTAVGVRCPCAADAACAVLARHGLPTAAVGSSGRRLKSPHACD